jgi:hypothetical protein
MTPIALYIKNEGHDTMKYESAMGYESYKQPVAVFPAPCFAEVPGDYNFFLETLGLLAARAPFASTSTSGGGKKEFGAAGCRVVKWDTAIFLFLPSLNWIIAEEAVISMTLPAPHSSAPVWLTMLPILITMCHTAFF